MMALWPCNSPLPAPASVLNRVMSHLIRHPPAKINVYLEVLGRRADGFHGLETLFLTIDLRDKLTLAPGAPGIVVDCAAPELTVTADNLVHRAALAFAAASGISPAWRFQLVKTIPTGAGLGGGSSDAAAALLLLQQRYQDPLDARALQELAAGLGADVPAFLHGGLCYGSERGDRIDALTDPPPLALTLAMPPQGLATPRVFAALDAAERAPRAPRGRDALATAFRAAPAALLHNRLEDAACRLAPDTARLLHHWRQRAIPCLMSGSGSACFALGHHPAPPHCRVWHVHSLPRNAV